MQSLPSVLPGLDALEAYWCILDILSLIFHPVETKYLVTNVKFSLLDPYLLQWKA